MRTLSAKNLLMLTAVFCLGPMVASGQTDYYQVNYLANFQAGDSYVNLMNAGGADPTASGICANVYVFAPDEQMLACCSCPLTPNQLATLSAKKDLTVDTLFAFTMSSLSVELVATKNKTGQCDPTGLLGETLASGLRAWAVTLEPASVTTYGVTKTEFSQVTPNSSQIQLLAGLCTYIQANGSGYGVCNACRSGASGAVFNTAIKSSPENQKQPH
jgi:hypothetical protein